MTDPRYPYSILETPVLGSTLITVYLLITSLFQHGYAYHTGLSFSPFFPETRDRGLVGYVISWLIQLVLRLICIANPKDTDAPLRQRVYLIFFCDILAIMVWLRGMTAVNGMWIVLSVLLPGIGSTYYPLRQLWINCWKDYETWAATNKPAPVVSHHRSRKAD
jgi:hypothetical protein